MENRDILIYLSIKHNGDWRKIYHDIINHIEVEVDEEEVIKTCQSVKSKVLTILDPDYPKYLYEITNPPFCLFYYGDLSLMYDYYRNLGVVGSRACSEYGATMTRKIVSELNGEFNIVSGLARGIDTVAHIAAIESGCKTIAVLPSGIDNCYPISNKELYEIIKAEHLIISEYPNDYVPNENNFRIRNRLIAGLSCGLLVGESTGYSGTLITITNALDFGRNVFCVPYRFTDNSHCTRLVKEGAFLVDNGDDIVYELKKFRRDIK